MALFMVLRPHVLEGLTLSTVLYYTLENLQLHLQASWKRPLGAIQEEGVGALKKMFIDDIETIELLWPMPCPEGLSNLAGAFVFVAMFLVEAGSAFLCPSLWACWLWA